MAIAEAGSHNSPEQPTNRCKGVHRGCPGTRMRAYHGPLSEVRGLPVHHATVCELVAVHFTKHLVWSATRESRHHRLTLGSDKNTDQDRALQTQANIHPAQGKGPRGNIFNNNNKITHSELAIIISLQRKVWENFKSLFVHGGLAALRTPQIIFHLKFNMSKGCLRKS